VGVDVAEREKPLGVAQVTDRAAPQRPGHAGIEDGVAGRGRRPRERVARRDEGVDGRVDGLGVAGHADALSVAGRLDGHVVGVAPELRVEALADGVGRGDDVVSGVEEAAGERRRVDAAESDVHAGRPVVAGGTGGSSSITPPIGARGF
jgi:hypothetical protein